MTDAPDFKIIQGQRDQLECQLVESLCLGDFQTYKALRHRLDYRANLELLTEVEHGFTVITKQDE